MAFPSHQGCPNLLWRMEQRPGRGLGSSEKPQGQNKSILGSDPGAGGSSSGLTELLLPRPGSAEFQGHWKILPGGKFTAERKRGWGKSFQEVNSLRRERGAAEKCQETPAGCSEGLPVSQPAGDAAPTPPGAAHSPRTNISITSGQAEDAESPGPSSAFCRAVGSAE